MHCVRPEKRIVTTSVSRLENKVVFCVKTRVFRLNPLSLHVVIQFRMRVCFFATIATVV